MTVLQLLFYTFSGITAFGALSILWSKKLLYNALSLLLSLIGLAGVYVLAGADFVAVTQLMVYVGGVLVLLLFGIMFTQRSKGEAVMQVESSRIGQAMLLSLSLILGIGYAISHAGWISMPAVEPQWMGNTINLLGVQLMTRHLLAFEVIGILLLAALIGAMNIASGKR